MGIPPEQVVGGTFGNSNGDLQMLMWVTDGEGARLSLPLHRGVRG